MAWVRMRSDRLLVSVGRRHWSVRSLALTLGATSTTLICPAASQENATIRGTVVAAASQSPLAESIVSLSDESQADTTGADGVFQVEGLAQGTHQLILRRIGFAPRSFRFTLTENHMGLIDIGPIALEPQATELPGVTVEGAAVHPWLRDFERRSQSGFGDFITRDEFMRWNPSRPTEILRHTTGMRIRPNPNYGRGDDSRRVLVESSRTPSRGLLEKLGSGGECPALFFLDGIYIGSGAKGDTQMDDIVSVHTIEAIEVYSGGAQAPAEFNRSGSECGVVVIWTRR